MNDQTHANQGMRLRLMLETADAIKGRTYDMRRKDQVQTWRVDETGRLQCSVAGEGGRPFVATRTAERQICRRYGIPARYWDTMKDAGMRQLAMDNLNQWRMSAEHGENTMLLRTLNAAPGDDYATLRAVLSHRYRVLDSRDALYATMEHLQKQGIAADIDERHMQGHIDMEGLCIKVQAPSLAGQGIEPSDLIVGGFCLSNSDVGAGSLKLEAYVYRVACSNGMIVPFGSIKQIHLGNGNDDAAVYDRIRLAIDNTVAAFPELCEQIGRAGRIEFTGEMVTPLVDHTVKEYEMTDAQRDNILMAFGAEPRNDMYGLANAITRAAQQEETFTGRTDMERIGGGVLFDDTLLARANKGQVRRGAPGMNKLEME